MGRDEEELLTAAGGAKQADRRKTGADTRRASVFSQQSNDRRFADRASRFCRYTGLLVIRKLRVVKRRASELRECLVAALHTMGNAVQRAIRVFAVRNGIALPNCSAWVESLRSGSRDAAKKGIESWLFYWLRTTLGGLFKGLARIFGSINYIAPIMAAVVFATVVHVTLNMNFALQVKYNGETVGYITDESVFDQAEKEVLKRIVFEDYIRPEDTIPEFAVSVVKKDQIIDEYELTNQLIKASGNELAEATGLYVDEEFKGAVRNREALATVLDTIKNQFRTEDGESDEGETVEFVKDVKMVDGLYPLTSIADIRNIEAELNKQEAQQRIYTAVKGDAPITIAAKNDIPYSQLKALNPDIEKKLMIGQEVLVEKAVPTLEVKVIRTETFNEDISFKIEQIQDSNQMQGYTNVTQKGQKGIEQVIAKVTYIDGVETARDEINRSTIKEPVNEKIVVGGKRPLEKIPAVARAASGNFIWPTDGGYVTCAFGSAGYWGHTGMDIGGQGTGAAVRAAASGTVTKVVYNNYGYGYHLMVDHGGGVQTLYAHNSKIYVKVGDWVEQGDLIAGMGRTGNATGIHVHFEIRVNGKYMNPANYIGTRCPY